MVAHCTVLAGLRTRRVGFSTAETTEAPSVVLGHKVRWDTWHYTFTTLRSHRELKDDELRVGATVIEIQVGSLQYTREWCVGSCAAVVEDLHGYHRGSTGNANCKAYSRGMWSPTSRFRDERGVLGSHIQLIWSTSQTSISRSFHVCKIPFIEVMRLYLIVSNQEMS